MVSDAKEGVSQLVGDTVKLCPLALPLKEGWSEAERPEPVGEAEGDLLIEEDPVKLIVEEATPEEVFVIHAVRLEEGDTETDFDRIGVEDWLIDPELLFDRSPVALEVLEAVPDRLTETDPLVVELPFTLTVEDSVELNELVELADGDNEAAADAESYDPLAEKVAPDGLASSELLIDIVPLAETLFDTIPEIVCVMVRISVRVPVDVTVDDAVIVFLELFEPIGLTVAVTVAEDVLERVELELLVELPPALLVIRGLLEALAVGVLVFDGAVERDSVPEAVFVFDAYDAETVGEVVDVFEVEIDFV